MNILDENTKAMLDAGKVAVLDGGYIALTPETLFQTVQGATLETLGDIMMEQASEEESNGSFIQHGFKCHFCGKENDYTEYIMTIAGAMTVNTIWNVCQWKFAPNVWKRCLRR